MIYQIVCDGEVLSEHGCISYLNFHTVRDRLKWEVREADDHVLAEVDLTDRPDLLDCGWAIWVVQKALKSRESEGSLRRAKPTQVGNAFRSDRVLPYVSL